MLNFKCTFQIACNRNPLATAFRLLRRGSSLSANLFTGFQVFQLSEGLMSDLCNKLHVFLLTSANSNNAKILCFQLHHFRTLTTNSLITSFMVRYNFQEFAALQKGINKSNFFLESGSNVFSVVRPILKDSKCSLTVTFETSSSSLPFHLGTWVFFSPFLTVESELRGISSTYIPGVTLISFIKQKLEKKHWILVLIAANKIIELTEEGKTLVESQMYLWLCPYVYRWLITYLEGKGTNEQIMHHAHSFVIIKFTPESVSYNWHQC